jgi:hypothetical protein
MSRRLVAAAGMLALALSPVFSAPAAAQDAPVSLGSASFAPAASPSFLTSIGVSVPLVDLDQLGRPPMPPATERVNRGSSRLMNSLYASTAVMQALDVHSTLAALNSGGVEANPMMSGLTGNKAAFIAVKAAVATTTILATRQLAKRNKVAAVVTLVAINSAYAFVASHNYRVASGLK